MSTLKDKLLFPIITAVIAGLILFWLKDEIPKWPDVTINVGNNNSGGNTIQNPSTAPANWPAPIKELVNNMIDIKGGLFSMGCTTEQKDCGGNEKEHWVRLSDYQLGKYEVTQAQWRAVMNRNRSGFNCDRCAVQGVNWNDVQLFIGELNRITGKEFRLPTEAEWEFAARGGVKSTPTLYAGSYSIDKVAWYSENSGRKTHPVGELAPNELGLYDMSGNVREWCSDLYGKYTVQANAVENPQGAKSGSSRVLRGGGWNSRPRNCRVANRDDYDPAIADFYLGFRLAHSL